MANTSAEVCKSVTQSDNQTIETVAEEGFFRYQSTLQREAAPELTIQLPPPSPCSPEKQKVAAENADSPGVKPTASSITGGATTTVTPATSLLGINVDPSGAAPLLRRFKSTREKNKKATPAPD